MAVSVTLSGLVGRKSERTEGLRYAGASALTARSLSSIYFGVKWFGVPFGARRRVCTRRLWVDGRREPGLRPFGLALGYPSGCGSGLVGWLDFRLLRRSCYGAPDSASAPPWTCCGLCGQTCSVAVGDLRGRSVNETAATGYCCGRCLVGAAVVRGSCGSRAWGRSCAASALRR